LSSLAEHYRRYRLADPAAEAAMARSLLRYGQLAPLTACWRADRLELLDGFKRRAAAACAAWPSLSVRVLEVDERSAKAAIFGLNSTGRRPNELEEAWIVQALVREDGMSQVEVAALLERHKSWVCRRLALLERLCNEAQADLRLGLLSVGLARQLTRLPVGNQAAVLDAARREGLTQVEVRCLIDLLRGASPQQQAVLLQDVRAALVQAAGGAAPVRDGRLSAAGNRLARQVGALLDLLGRLENAQRQRGLAELTRDDRRLLAPRLIRLATQARGVALLVEELWQTELAETSSSTKSCATRSSGAGRVGRRYAAWPESWVWHATRCRTSSAAGKPNGLLRKRRRAGRHDGRAWSIPSTRRSSSCWHATRTSRLRASSRSCAGWASAGGEPSSASGCCNCDRSQPASRCSASRPQRERRHKWTTAATTSTLPRKAAASTCSATC
jgi:hypothetical protein